MLSTSDNPALKRTTITSMMMNAVTAGRSLGQRAGHGWDGAASVGGGKYYGQKGGSLDTSGNVLEFNGDWGFAMCWAGKLIAPYKGKGWYPDFTAVMDIAKAANWPRGRPLPAVRHAVTLTGRGSAAPAPERGGRGAKPRPPAPPGSARAGRTVRQAGHVLLPLVLGQVAPDEAADARA